MTLLSFNFKFGQAFLTLQFYQGEQGDSGDKGLDGAPGAPGLPGEPGRDGLTGLKGEKVPGSMPGLLSQFNFAAS